MQQGKLLALDLLVRVLTNPMHDWGHAMRPEFAAELRQPLCLLLLRNCMSPTDQAVTAAVRIFSAVLSAQVRAWGGGVGCGAAVRIFGCARCGGPGCGQEKDWGHRCSGGAGDQVYCFHGLGIHVSASHEP